MDEWTDKWMDIAWNDLTSVQCIVSVCFLIHVVLATYNCFREQCVDSNCFAERLSGWKYQMATGDFFL